MDRTDMYKGLQNKFGLHTSKIDCIRPHKPPDRVSGDLGRLSKFFQEAVAPWKCKLHKKWIVPSWRAGGVDAYTCVERYLKLETSCSI